MARLMDRSSLGLGLSNLRQFWWLMYISQLDDSCTVSLHGRRAKRISLIPSDNWDWRTASYKSPQYIFIVINVRITCSLSLWNNHLGNECTPKQYCIVIRYVIRLFTISILPVTFSLIKLPRRLGKLAETINSTCLVYKVIFDSVPDFLPPGVLMHLFWGVFSFARNWQTRLNLSFVRGFTICPCAERGFSKSKIASPSSVTTYTCNHAFAVQNFPLVI